MSSFSQIISDLRKELENLKKERDYEKLKDLEIKLDQTLLCEKKHKDFVENEVGYLTWISRIINNRLAELESEVKDEA
jgi:hypothetical protein